MAWAIVCTVDQPDPLNASEIGTRPKRGDVIDVFEDGADIHPGTEIMRDPRFVVIQATGVPVSEFAALAEHRLAGLDSLDGVDLNVPRRTRRINLDAIDLAGAVEVSVSTRTRGDVSPRTLRATDKIDGVANREKIRLDAAKVRGVIVTVR